MALDKVTYVENVTVIHASNLNDIQDEIIANAAAIADKQDTLTQEQLAAANSGITSTKVGTYDGYGTAIAGKQATIDSDNKLSSDLVDATGHTNQFVTASEKEGWDAKASTATATTSANGLMSSADKTKLNGLVAVSGSASGGNWTSITIDGTANNIPSGGGTSLHTYRL